MIIILLAQPTRPQKFHSDVISSVIFVCFSKIHQRSWNWEVIENCCHLDSTAALQLHLQLAAAVVEGKHKHCKVSDDCWCMKGGDREGGRKRTRGWKQRRERVSEREKERIVEVHLAGRLPPLLQRRWIQRTTNRVGGCFLFGLLFLCLRMLQLHQIPRACVCLTVCKSDGARKANWVHVYVLANNPARWLPLICSVCKPSGTLV